MSTVAFEPYRTRAASCARTLKPATAVTAVRKQKTWRLTRRGRFIFRGLPLLTFAALIVLGSVTLLIPNTARAGDGAQATAGTAVVTVRSGQSLWDIAADTSSGGDVRDVVNEIMLLNDLTSVSIMAGQELEVPVYVGK